VKARTLLRIGVAVASTAITGGLATDPNSAYYRALKKPSWQPAPPVYGIVWTPLYADLAVTTAQAADSFERQGEPGQRAALIRALSANLALNASWNWLFFKAHRPWVAAIECAALTASSADLVRRVAMADWRAGWALAPYPVWCAFATALTVAIARRNPR
jgi:benzodiazapine receptor